MAGHVAYSREYAVDAATDPFSLPRALRAIALRGVGHDFDDSAAFPRAKQAVVRPAARSIACFLRNRETILQQVGQYLFPDAVASERRARAKLLFNSLDMHGTVAGFYSRWGLDEATRPLGVLRLQGLQLDAGERFSIRQYQNLQREGSMWLLRRMGAMEQFVRAWLVHTGDRRRLRQPERTMCSYVWQEAEGISREAKLQWCVRAGHVVHNLQHDGCIIAPRAGARADEVAAQLRRACSHSLGYDQPVEVKAMT
jgi:hypothetical protein